MKKKILLALVCGFIAFTSYAQRITCEYNDVSLADALRQLNEQTDDYTISFLYNELEDFHITVSLRRQSVPDAVRQMIGFYPVCMTVEGREITVECIQKATMHYRGIVLDEQGGALPYTHVALLSPQDSTLLTGGVSNEDGLFVVPCEQMPVLARISYVGYKTVYLFCDSCDMGNIRMQQDTIVLKAVQVKGERMVVRTENGHLAYDMPMLLQAFPSNDAYEALTRIPGVVETGSGLNFCGRPVALIINGRATTLNAEQVAERLKNMPASMLARAEVMPSAPAKYHIRGMAINVVTKDWVGQDHASAQLQGSWRQCGQYGLANMKGSMLYSHGKLGLDVSYAFTDGDAYGKVEHEANHPLGSIRRKYDDETRNKSDIVSHNYRVGLDYAFGEDNRLSLAYTGEWISTHATNTTTGMANSIQQSVVHDYLHNMDVCYTAPFGLQLGASYTNYQNPRTQRLDGKMFDDIRNLTVDSRQRISKWLFTADQIHTVGKGLELSYGMKAQFTRNDSYQTTWDFGNREIADATSHVDYNERILDCYVGVSKQISKQLSLETSLTAEQYHSAQWNEWRIYPAFNVQWNVGANHLLNLSFSSESEYPSYWSTMSSIFYSSAYTEIWGNPNLRPSSLNEMNLMWQFNHRYTLMAFAVFQPDYSVQLAYQPADRMVVIMKETNYDYSNNCGLQVSAQFCAGTWLNGNATITGLYRHDKSDKFFDLPFDRSCLSAIFSATIAAKLSNRPNLVLTVNPFFQSKAIQGVYDIDPMFRLNASLRWISEDGKWSITASGRNVFNTYASTRSCLGNQDYTMRVWMEYAQFLLTATYRIGDFKEKKKRMVDTSRMGYQ
ncbi:MAG: TonB-dependent receptor [Bacteroidaceae bacterium]|nr:TonB-dependent receptor [Bacteroidaceae bacterium]